METIIDSKKTGINLKKIWSFRELFIFFALRDIKLRYKFKILAFFWASFPPFLISLIFAFSLGRAISGSPSHLPYIIFAYIGLIFWNLFSSSVSRCSGSLLNNKSLFTKVSFPKIIVPISSVIVSYIDFFVGFLFLFILLYLYKQPIHLAGVLFIIPSLLIIFLTSVGLGLSFGTLSIKYKDTREILPLLLSLLFFSTPIAYPIKLISTEFHILLFLNPLIWVIETIRSTLFSSEPINLLGLAVALTISLAIFSTGLAYYIYSEKELIDIL